MPCAVSTNSANSRTAPAPAGRLACQPQRARTVVTSGVYRHTRNPMYLGMLIVLAGWAVWLGSAAALLGLPLSVLLLNGLQIGPEERMPTGG